MRFPLPRSINRKMAESAVKHAREYGAKRGWRSTNRLEPVSRVGSFGIKVAPGTEYLFVQNFGMQPRVMIELEGKTIPMGNGQFRVARGVGQPGYVILPGGVRVWRNQKWRHPGIRPTRFLDNAMAFAVRQHKQELKGWLLAVVDPARERQFSSFKRDLAETANGR
jgi:hypothetical protein